MAIARWDPFREMMNVQDQLNRIVDSFWGGERKRGWIPSVDVFDGKDEVVLKVDLPGVKSDQVQVELDENILTVRGERSGDHEPDIERFYRVERPSGTFERIIALPHNVVGERIEASFEDGILTIHAPKVEESKPKRIEIQQGRELRHAVKEDTSERKAA